MGEVFKAAHTETGRLAAVKVLYRPEFAARFRNEAAVQASLAHPNIATLYESGLLDDRPALVMEWIDGISLDELIRRKGSLANDEATRIVRQIASAVSYLHQQGIIHRDLKPSNVRIRPNGQVKVLDFGIAKGRYTPQLTQAGHTVGTTEFMAPEQFRGQVEPKSDVWALGVLLYEMTTGQLPFSESNPIVLRKQIERGQYTRPQRLNAGLSPTLATLITDCLQANTARRLSATDIGQALSSNPDRVSKPAFSLATIRVGRVTPLYICLLAAAIGLVGYALVHTTLTPPQKPEHEVVAPADTYEQLRVEVLNADYDLELVMPDGTVQSKEPFFVKRRPGQSVPITIRHQGAEQQFVIDPDVRELYQCYFDR